MRAILPAGHLIDILYGQDYVAWVSSCSPTVVLVTSRSFSSGDLDLAAELTAAGCTIRTGPADHDPNVLRDGLADAVAWIAGTGPITAAHLDAAPKLRLIARYGVGTDAIDLAAAAARGIVVTNTPGANTVAVAEHTLALVLAAVRDIPAGNHSVRIHHWRVHRARQLASLTVGVVGAGRVGREVIVRMRALGSTVIVCDPYVDATGLERQGVRSVTVGELAATSDVVTLHAPGDQVIIDKDFLSRTRPGAILINTARGVLIDEHAVAAALRSGRLAIYASDVLSTETGGRACPLLAEDLADRTIFTPHTAAQTVQAVDAMGRGAVDAVLALLRGDPPQHLVGVDQ